MKTITAREFQKGYAKLTEPVSVNGATWFPKEYSWTDIQDVAIDENRDEFSRTEAEAAVSGDIRGKAPRSGDSHVKAPPAPTTKVVTTETSTAEGLAARERERARESAPPAARPQPRGTEEARSLIATGQAHRDAILRKMRAK